jgi:hypothetical protein
MKITRWLTQEIDKVLGDWRSDKVGIADAARALIRLGHLPAEAWDILTKETVRRDAANRVMRQG